MALSACCLLPAVRTRRQRLEYMSWELVYVPTTRLLAVRTEYRYEHRRSSETDRVAVVADIADN